MANNDPVSGLMASMSRIRGRRPDGTATQGTTAQQAGTILPVVRPAAPVAMPPVSMPIAAPAPTTVNPLIAAVRPSQPVLDPEVGRLTGLFVQSFPGLDQPTAALLAQQYLNEQAMGVPGQDNPSQSIPLA